MTPQALCVTMQTPQDIFAERVTPYLLHDLSHKVSLFYFNIRYFVSVVINFLSSSKVTS